MTNKNKLSKLLLLITIVFIFFLTSCQPDENYNTTNQNKNLNKVEFLNFDELSSRIKLTDELINKLNNKGFDKNQTDFTFNLDSIKAVKKENYESYTIDAKINNDSVDSYIYKVLIEKKNNKISSYLFTFKFENKKIVPVSKTDFTFNSNTERMECYMIIIEVKCTCHDHSDGSSCSHSETYTYSACSGGGYDDGSDDSGDGTTSSTGTNTTTSTYVTHTVILNEDEALAKYNEFFTKLLPPQKLFLTENDEASTSVFLHLWANDFNVKAQTFVKQLIDYCNANPSVSLANFQTLINIIDDGKINGRSVVVAPNIPITNMSNYLSCFNTTQGATISICTDQPVTGEHSIWSTSKSVGHAFITIKQGDTVKSLGFYPQVSVGSIIPNNLTPNPLDFYSTSGIFGNDEGHAFDVSLSVPINSTGLTNIINGFITLANSNPQYNINYANCTDIAIATFEVQTNINIPDSESPTLWQGQTPGTLGEVIRNMQTPSGATKNTTGGNAPINNCN